MTGPTITNIQTSESLEIIEIERREHTETQAGGCLLTIFVWTLLSLLL